MYFGGCWVYKLSEHCPPDPRNARNRLFEISNRKRSGDTVYTRRSANDSEASMVRHLTAALLLLP